jgi:4,5-DOPA dioxygenase extradiol
MQAAALTGRRRGRYLARCSEGRMQHRHQLSLLEQRLSRRSVLAVAGGALLAGCGSGRGATETTPLRESSMPNTADRMPALFVAHGAPMLLDDPRWMGELSTWAGAMRKPRGILVVSAHWEERPVTLGATETVPLVYDFHGFAPKYYQTQYRAPGAPWLAERVRGLLSPHQKVEQDERRGLDHGAYVPLVAMYPNAEVPVLQMSLPTLDATELHALGRALAPLRDEGVLIMGSGFITHNMRAIDWSGKNPPPSWASEFDLWAKETLGKGDVDALLDYRRRAPGVAMSLPTVEHFVPAIVAQGAASVAPAEVRFPIEGFWMGSFTRRSVQFG